MPKTTVSKYAEALLDISGHLATWSPTSPLLVGDVVRIAPDGVIEPVTNAASLSLDVITRATNPGDDIRLSRGVSLTLETDVDALGQRAVAGFDSAGSFLVAATLLTGAEVVDVQGLEESIRGLADSKLWKPEWLLVTSVIAVERLTVAVAKSNSARASIQVEDASLTVRAGGQVQVTSGQAATFSASTGATPLYRAYKLGARTPFGKTKWLPKRFGAAGSRNGFTAATLGDVHLA